MDLTSSGSGSGISSIIQSTKTKLMVLSSLLGVGAIYYFTRNYLRNGQLLPSWRSSEKSVVASEKSRQPKIIGGMKRIVSIKEDGIDRASSNHVFKRQKSRSRRSSVSSRRSTATKGILVNTPSNENINLDKAINELDVSLLEVEHIFKLQNDQTGLYKHNNERNNILVMQDEINRLRKLIDFAQDVQLVSDRASDFVQKQTEAENDAINEVTTKDMQNENYNELVNYLRNQKESYQDDDDYDSDNDSFISATESIDLQIDGTNQLRETLVYEKSLKDLITKNNKKDFYMQGIEYLTNYGVPVRTIRDALLNCENEVDFCVKVFCIRRAFKDLLREKSNRDWFIETGKEMLISLLKKNKCDVVQFSKDFDKMIEYCEDTANLPLIDEELSKRGVCCLNFYDVVLDLMIMDAFEDLTNPPSSVLSAIQNRWLSLRIKETALATAIWTVIKGKKRMLKNANGFYSKFYDMSMHITPILAWGFLGPVKELNDLCNSFKNSLVGFMQDIFSTNLVNYKSVETLAGDIFKLAKQRKEELLTILT